MSFRGGGRGRGRGGGGFFTAKQEPFHLFPEGVVLPDVNDVIEEKALVILNNKLERFLKSSPYYLEDAVSLKTQEPDIERYCDRANPKIQAKRRPLAYYLHLTSDNFPKELVQGTKQVKYDQRNVRWNPDTEFQKLDFLANREKRHQDKDGNTEKEKKEGENEEDEEEDVEEEDAESSDDGDYNQGADFDDDDEDLAIDEGGGDDENVY